MRGSIHVAEVNDGLRCTVGRDHVTRAVDGGPHLRHRFQFWRESTALSDGPIGRDVIGICQEVFAQAVKRLLDRVERIHRAGEDGVLDQRMKRFGQFTASAVVDVKQFAFRLLSRYGHPGFRQHAGLVGAKLNFSSKWTHAISSSFGVKSPLLWGCNEISSLIDYRHNGCLSPMQSSLQKEAIHS